MAQYRKKPVVIEAFHFLRDPMPDWFMDRVTDNSITLVNCYHREGQADIKTLEGTMTANAGDWIIKGVQGEIYPCKPDIFSATYNEVITRLEKPTIDDRKCNINPDGSVTMEVKA